MSEVLAKFEVVVMTTGAISRETREQAPAELKRWISDPNLASLEGMKRDIGLTPEQPLVFHVKDVGVPTKIALIETPESSNIAAFGYLENSRLLEVVFRGGGKYHYYDVPPELYEKFVEAPSKGRFFTQSVRGKFEYKIVREGETAG